MTLLKYILVAMVQGFTEPLPISSSGHMRLFTEILNLKSLDINYEIVCNFGSFLAILIIFWKDIIKLISDFFSYIFNSKTRIDTKKGFFYCINIVISTIPVMITGLLFKDFIESKLNNINYLGIAYIITSLSLFLVRNLKGTKKDYELTIKDALVIGLFQSIAIVPGISRSGIILVGCLLSKLDRSSSLKYTFILYFPVSVGSMLLGTIDIIKNPNLNNLILPYVLGVIIACVITYFVYRWMQKWIKKGNLLYFSLYCLLLALVIFIFL